MRKEAIGAPFGLVLGAAGYLLDLLGRKQRAQEFDALLWSVAALIDSARLPAEDIRHMLVSLVAGAAQRADVAMEVVQAEIAAIWEPVAEALGTPAPLRDKDGALVAACPCCQHPLGAWPKPGDTLTCPFCGTRVVIEVVTSRFGDAAPATPQGGS